MSDIAALEMLPEETTEDHALKPRDCGPLSCLITGTCNDQLTYNTAPTCAW
ncbi:hypothetical protein GCM10022251_44200 [Phytohabitans flavus]|uniref:Lantibiotic n=1 Tax=Phytohabitans flavus TaxID=1076124 RepID=A0A6F8XYI4_9ACTN|nr:hypothetical protein [Phytohabitans flavus]BCB78859.1 hypothetical protein Pflav_052690 [Phytohabitans flavus]